MGALKWLIVAGVVVVSGCGGDDEPSKQTLTPAAIEGGGVRGPALDGHVYAYVLDSSGKPIEHASLVLGEGSAARTMGETDAKGLFKIEDPSLTANAVLGAKASGFRTVTYAGISGSLVTFALPPLAATSDTITVNGSIAGWSALAAPAAGKYRAARVIPSLPVSLATFDALAPSEKDDCFRNATSDQCAFTLEVPAGTERLLGVIVEGDEAGTPADRSDDTLTVTGLATSGAPSDGASVSMNTLTNEKTALATVSLGNATGLVGVIGVPGVSSGGQVTVYPFFPGKAGDFLIPLAEGDLGQAKLWGVAFATDASKNVESLVVSRGIDVPKTAGSPISLALGDFLAPPSVTVSGGILQITRAEAAVHQLDTGAEQVFILDDRTSYEPAGGVTNDVTVTATDAPFDAMDFELNELAATLTRRASQRAH